MNICVCVKLIEHIYARTGLEPEHEFLTPEDRIFRSNPYDEAAIVLALKVKSQLEDVKITLVNIGSGPVDEELWRLMGLGGDRLCCIELISEAGDNAAVDSWGKAQALGKALKTMEADVVLCGKESLDRQNGLVAGYVAHLLDRPFVSGIIDLNLVETAGSARITRNAGKGRREVIDCFLPAVFSVDLSAGAPPVAAFKKVREVQNKAVNKMIFDRRMLGARTHQLATCAPRPRPKPVAAPDSRLSSFERVQQLLSGSRVQKKSKLVTGSPVEQTDAIMKFLEDHGFIELHPKGKTTD